MRAGIDVFDGFVRGLAARAKRQIFSGGQNRRGLTVAAVADQELERGRSIIMGKTIASGALESCFPRELGSKSG
jgi:hypothetical protein